MRIIQIAQRVYFYLSYSYTQLRLTNLLLEFIMGLLPMNGGKLNKIHLKNDSAINLAIKRAFSWFIKNV